MLQGAATVISPNTAMEYRRLRMSLSFMTSAGYPETNVTTVHDCRTRSAGNSGRTSAIPSIVLILIGIPSARLKSFSPEALFAARQVDSESAAKSIPSCDCTHACTHHRSPSQTASPPTLVLDDFPVIDVGPWPADLSLRREDMHGDNGRGSPVCRYQRAGSRQYGGFSPADGQTMTD